MRPTRKRRGVSAINAGSMADIAFLLLIFFLVTTTILVDTGIAVRLPPWSGDPPTPIASRNILSVSLNAHDELLVDGGASSVSQLKQAAMDFIMNPTGAADRPSAPNRAVIALLHDRSTSYQFYLQVYNELVSAYQELWEREARQRFGAPYRELPAAWQAQVRARIPFVISEAEPVEYTL